MDHLEGDNRRDDADGDGDEKKDWRSTGPLPAVTSEDTFHRQ